MPRYRFTLDKVRGGKCNQCCDTCATPLAAASAANFTAATTAAAALLGERCATHIMPQAKPVQLARPIQSKLPCCPQNLRLRPCEDCPAAPTSSCDATPKRDYARTLSCLRRADILNAVRADLPILHLTVSSSLTLADVAFSIREVAANCHIQLPRPLPSP